VRLYHIKQYTQPFKEIEFHPILEVNKLIFNVGSSRDAFKRGGSLMHFSSLFVAASNPA
jgi:hypothetical protein